MEGGLVMADEADIANDAAMADLERRLAAHRAALSRPAPELCAECEDPIPSERRALGLRLCIDCARLLERRARLFSK